MYEQENIIVKYKLNLASIQKWTNNEISIGALVNDMSQISVVHLCSWILGLLNYIAKAKLIHDAKTIGFYYPEITEFLRFLCTRTNLDKIFYMQSQLYKIIFLESDNANLNHTHTCEQIILLFVDAFELNFH